MEGPGSRVRGEDNSAFTVDSDTLDYHQIAASGKRFSSILYKKSRRDLKTHRQEEDKTEKQPEEVKQDEEPRRERVGPFQLFRFANKLDVLLTLCGIITSVGSGACFPVLFYIYGNAVSGFVYHDIYDKMNSSMAQNLSYKYSPAEVENIFDFIRDGFTIKFALLGVLAFVLTLIGNLCLDLAGERQTRTIQKLYFRALISQEITWSDVTNTRKIAASFSGDMTAISDGLGGKTTIFYRSITIWLGGFITALVIVWKLALATMATLPLVIAFGVVCNKLVYSHTRKEKEQYAKAGAVAEEVFSAIKTVMAFNGQEKECKRYNEKLVSAERVIERKEVMQDASVAFFHLMRFVSSSACIVVGIELFLTQNMEPGLLLTVFMLINFGSVSLMLASQTLAVIVTAREAAYRVFPVISDFKSSDREKDDGLKPSSTSGEVCMNDVTFAYPSRADVNVLKSLSFEIKSGQTVALVGHSGCGKSTVVSLLERFYDPQKGNILLDNTDIKDLNRTWLRQQIGYVGQEPVLFSVSIAENIQFGNTDASREDVIRAAVTANAHEFISELPKGYDTYVGDSGCQLSGGQKQRIAIARALVRNPTILLLDEATSALDSASEALVQQAVDKAKQGRTTLIIAHRLSTVMRADMLLVMKEGEIIEQGTHLELLEKNGYYKQLIESQVGFLREDRDYTEPDPGDILLSDKIFSDNGEYADKTVTSDDGEEEEQQEYVEVRSPIKRLLELNRPERHLNVIGCILAAMFGLLAPAMAYAMSETLSVFSDSPEETRRRTKIIIAVMMGVATGFVLIRLLAVICLSKSSARLITRIREKLFSTLIYQDVQFFDEPRHRVGLLTTRLADDALAIQGASAVKFGSVLECVVALLAAIVVAMIHSWKLSLVVLCFTPISLISMLITGRSVSGRGQTKDGQSKAQAGQMVQESLGNLRLIQSLACEDVLIKDFNSVTDSLFWINLKSCLPTVIANSVSDSVLLFLYSAVLTYGAYLVQSEGLPFFYIFRVFMALNQSTAQVGRVSALTPDFSNAKEALLRVFRLLDKQPTIKVLDQGKIPQERLSGKLDMKDVQFQYPSRPNVGVLAGVTFSVLPGQRLALVGSSGCGKTTTIALIQRLYDVSSGHIAVDGTDIRELDLRWYRSQIGLVSQEPVLFDRTVAENIQYGDNSREVPMSEVIEVARKANLHGLVEKFPQGYDTVVGNKGTQLSGGEKQRVAIARALIRDPSILLLDEATSALDTRNEQIVQEALDKASHGRTTITIAHRLSTIQHSDVILVIDKGTIKEQGTHDELTAKKGLYYRMLQLQNRQA